MSLKFKRSYPILILLTGVLAFFGIGLGNQRVIAYTTQPDPAASPSTEPVLGHTNPVGLFDSSLVHSLQIEMDASDYRKMIATYQRTGEKDTFPANLVIDGVSIQQVGIRPKGHASLMTQVCVERPGGRPPEADRPTRPAQAEGQTATATPAPGAAPTPTAEPADRQPPPAPPGGSIPSGCKLPGAWNNNRSVEEVAQLPLLIQFDRYVAGQTYNGYAAIAVRTGGVTSDAAMLQEPLTNATYRQLGQPAPLAAYTGLSFNAGPEKLYVITEVIDETYLARHFPGTSGVLYKALLGADILADKGADPSAYANSFSQETRRGEADLAPLIDFIGFINQADDATFARQLPTYLDVDAFATYLAINSLLVNKDSLVSGNGNNFYLYYNEADGKMTLLFWDGNESLGTYSTRRAVTSSIFLEPEQGSSAGQPARQQNILLRRFLAEPSFRALFEQKLRLVYARVFTSGALAARARQYSALVLAANSERQLVDPQAYQAARDNVLSFIQHRGDYLENSGLLDGK